MLNLLSVPSVVARIGARTQNRVHPQRHRGPLIQENFSRFVIASFLTPAFLTPLAASPRHHHHFVSVDLMRATTATMTDGTKLHVQIVKMNGRMMVAIPVGDLPDYLHQQIFLPSDR
jgi:hypothetical protein